MSWQPQGWQPDGFQPEGWQPGSVSGASPPVLLGSIPPASFRWETDEHIVNAGAYFSGATSYTISPAVETGWSFNTSTGVLTVDTDEIDSFGPFTVTASNLDGNTVSNAFSIQVFWGTFGDYSGTNANTTTNVPVNYSVCDRSGFKVRAVQLVKEWTGRMVRRQDWEPRHPQDFVRGRAEKAKGSPRPEATDTFIADDNQVSASDL
jgi:hypothetical protein